MKYPIGIQTFSELITGGYVYVDKTALVYKLAKDGKYYFLSRPRRFGKSMLISTLESYFEGRKDLFKGLAMEGLEQEWKQYPVFHIDLNTVERGRPESVDVLLDVWLKRWEATYHVTDIAGNFGMRFANVIRAAYEQTGRQVAILIDEYDKPMLAQMENGEPTGRVREKMKAFYSVLKSEDRYIRFALLTGVTRFSKVSVFSDLNNLKDISMDPRYEELCGISEKELHEVFDEQIGELAESNRMSKEACYQELARRYDGYHFAYDTVAMYNPFSVLNALDTQRFSNYWFSTGTPTFLLDAMKRTGFDFAKGFSKPINANTLADVDAIDTNPVPVLFQSGYLTIKGYEPMFQRYTLDFPNTEVREGFMNCLLPKYSNAGSEGLNTVADMVIAVQNGDTDTIAETLKTLFDARGNYMLYEEKSKERDFRNIVYMIFSFLDIYAQAELCTAAGRMDITVETKDYTYVIELKLDQTAATALQQIKDNGYANRFKNDPRQLILMGVNFSTKTNSIDDWAAELL